MSPLLQIQIFQDLSRSQMEYFLRLQQQPLVNLFTFGYIKINFIHVDFNLPERTGSKFLNLMASRKQVEQPKTKTNNRVGQTKPSCTLLLPIYNLHNHA